MLTLFFFTTSVKELTITPQLLGSVVSIKAFKSINVSKFWLKTRFAVGLTTILYPQSVKVAETTWVTA